MKNKIKVERAINNLTQADLANLLKVSRQTVNAVETGKFIPSSVLALKIAKIFGKKVEDIFTLEDSDFKTEE
jgi:putative transcriptional regulator